MKKNILLIIASILMFGCASTGQNDSKSGYNTEYESMDIKVINPTAMVAPSKNERAMREYAIGTQFLYDNKLNDAEKHLKNAINLDPVFVDAMDHLGMVYRRQNRLREAENIYLKSIEINDKNKVPYQNLAVVYRLQNKLNEALALYQKMIVIDSKDPEPYYGIGELFFITGNYENSMAYFDKAIELYISQKSPYVYDAYYYKGMIYYQQNRLDDALKYLEESQKGNPNNETIKRTIDEIRNKRA